MIVGCLAAMSPLVPVPPDAATSANCSGSGVGVVSGESRTALTVDGSRSVLFATGLMSAKRVGTGGASSESGFAAGPAGAGIDGAGAAAGAGAGSAVRVAAMSSADSAAAVSGFSESPAGSSSPAVASGASAREVVSMSTPESLIWTVVVSVPR